MQDESDDALMRRAGSGDKAAFALLVQRHLARATALAQRIVGNRSDAIVRAHPEMIAAARADEQIRCEIAAIEHLAALRAFAPQRRVV